MNLRLWFDRLSVYADGIGLIIFDGNGLVPIGIVPLDPWGLSMGFLWALRWSLKSAVNYLFVLIWTARLVFLSIVGRPHLIFRSTLLG